MRPGPVILLLWIGFVASWVAAALWSAKPAKRVEPGAARGYQVAVIVGALLLAVPVHNTVATLRLWEVTRAEAWICAALIALGIAFSWWARLHLGRLWSGRITTKPGHRVIDTGPYRIVRHPIYTGLLLALFATAAAKGTVWGCGAIVIAFGFWLKARLEERWLAQELDPGTYAAYRRRVPMLLPFGPKGD